MAEGFTILTGIITLVVCLLGIIGNLLCLLVLLNKAMPPSSFKYILLGLTFSDLFLLILSSFRTATNLAGLDLRPYGWLQLVIFFWDWIATSGTKYYTVAVSLERFFVVNFPLKAVWLTQGRAMKGAFGVLLFVISLSGFSFVYVNYLDPESFPIYVAVVLHFTPFLLVLVLNIFVFLGLRAHKKVRASLTQSKKSEEDSITTMLFAVVVVFGLCYSFEFVRRIMNFLWKDYMSAHSYYDYTINHLADIFYVLNSSVNFIIYCLLGRSFRAVFFKIMGKYFPTWRCEVGSDGKVKLGGATSSSSSSAGSQASHLSVISQVGSV